mgnify:CR=1 FL=1
MFKNLINGEWSDGPRASRNINPSDTRDLIGDYAQADAAQAKQAIAAARLEEGLKGPFALEAPATAACGARSGRSSWPSEGGRRASGEAAAAVRKVNSPCGERPTCRSR